MNGPEVDGRQMRPTERAAAVLGHAAVGSVTFPVYLALDLCRIEAVAKGVDWEAVVVPKKTSVLDHMLYL